MRITPLASWIQPLIATQIGKTRDHRKKDKTNGMVALKAVAHKLARACYYVLRDQAPFQMEKAFG